MAAPKKTVDWEGIETAYRIGIKGLRQIAEEFSTDEAKISEGAIRKRANKERWVRDLQDKIRAQAEQKLNEATAGADKKAKTEREIIEINAEVQRDIVLEHRKDITRTRTLTMNLLAELEAVTNHKELIEQLSFLLENPDGDEGRNRAVEALRKAMSLPGRAGTLKAIADSLKNLIALEREAFGVDDKKAGGGNVEDILKKALNRGS